MPWIELNQIRRGDVISPPWGTPPDLKRLRVETVEQTTLGRARPNYDGELSMLTPLVRVRGRPTYVLAGPLVTFDFMTDTQAYLAERPDVVYRIWRDDRGVHADVCKDNDVTELPLREPKHSPTGFEFGYAGSGPSELARQMLWHHYGEEPQPACYNAFMAEALVSREPNDDFVITNTQIDDWVELWKSEADFRFATLNDEKRWLIEHDDGSGSLELD